MKLMTRILVPMLVLGMVGIADAKGKKGGKSHKLKGEIVSVATDGSSMVIKEGKKKGGAEKTVTLTATPTVTVDGGTAKLSDLVAGEKVTITEKKGTASEIKATTKKHHHKKK